MEIITPMSQYSQKKQAHLVKECKCFCCKERNHTAYDCPKKEKIATISEGVSKKSNT